MKCRECDRYLNDYEQDDNKKVCASCYWEYASKNSGLCDLTEFLRFFKRMGVSYHIMYVRFDDDLIYSIPGVRYWVSVSQCHFCFSEEGEYIGALSDEMGGFAPRRELC